MCVSSVPAMCQVSHARLACSWPPAEAPQTTADLGFDAPLRAVVIRCRELASSRRPPHADALARGMRRAAGELTQLMHQLGFILAKPAP